MDSAKGEPNIPESGSRRVLHVAWLIALIAIKLTLITAMANHNIADFVYQGF